MEKIKHYRTAYAITITIFAISVAACAELRLPPADSGCSNICTPNPNSQTIIGCDDRVPKPESVNSTKEEPWRFIGSFDGGNNCSGTLIADKFVLTAAHCMVNQGSQLLGFALAQEAENVQQRPFGTHGVRRVFIPSQFQSNSSEQSAAYDYALAELQEPFEGAIPASWGHVPWDILRTKPVFTAGYPGTQPDGGFLGRPWLTGGQNYPLSQSFRWLDDGKAGLLYTYLDGTGGQSGSPVFSFLTPSEHDGQGIIRKVTGVLIGSPVPACMQDQMWVVRLTPGAVEHIKNAIDPGTIDFWWQIINIPTSPNSGPGQAWP